MRFVHSKFIVAAIVIAGFGTSTLACAAFADLDTTFGDTASNAKDPAGFTATELGGNGDRGLSITTGKNDTLYAFGAQCNDASATTNGNLTTNACLNGNSRPASTFVVTRYTKDGVLDTTFGTGGKLSLTPSTGFSFNDNFEVDDTKPAAPLFYIGTQNCTGPGTCTIGVARVIGSGTNAGKLDTSFNTPDR